MAESYVRIYQNLLNVGYSSRPDAATRPHHRGLLRLLAAVFSGGFLASDDHHVVIGAAERIASGVGLP